MDCKNCISRNTPEGVWPCEMKGDNCPNFHLLQSNGEELCELSIFESFLKDLLVKDKQTAISFAKLLYNVLKQPGVKRTDIRNVLLKLNIV